MCNKCILQQVGKTMDKFRLRWNNYKMIDGNFLDGQTCIQQHLYEHFASEGYCNFIEDATITFIDNTDPKGPNQREHY